MKQFEQDFKAALQVSEREIMKSFNFKKKMAFDGGHFVSVLGETTQLVDDHLVINYQSDIESDNMDEIKAYKQNLRKVEH